MDPGPLAVQASDTSTPAEGLRAVRALRRLTDTLELRQVEAALRAGLSWTDIAGHLGVTRQAVHKKYKDRVSDDLRRGRRR